MSSTPHVIIQYFDAAERGATEELVACFSDDAWVFDEGNRYEGKDGIRTWRAKTSSAYTYTLQVRGATAMANNRYAVDTHLEGDFPGGVVDLTQMFTLRGGLIASLEI